MRFIDHLVIFFLRAKLIDCGAHYPLNTCNWHHKGNTNFLEKIESAQCYVEELKCGDECEKCVFEGLMKKRFCLEWV